jgi:lysine/ornithine N-monooxygenase
LHTQNRLVDFINRGSTTPTRKEYSDYLAWAAGYVQDQGINVAYGEDVIAIEEEGEGIVQVHSKVLATGKTRIRLASQCQSIVMPVYDLTVSPRKFNHLSRRLAAGPAVSSSHFATPSHYSQLIVLIVCRSDVTRD